MSDEGKRTSIDVDASTTDGTRRSDMEGKPDNIDHSDDHRPERLSSAKAGQ